MSERSVMLTIEEASKILGAMENSFNMSWRSMPDDHLAIAAAAVGKIETAFPELADNE
jgi:hypothetical protein